MASKLWQKLNKAIPLIMKMKWLVIIAVMLFLLPPFASAQECDYSVEILIEGIEFTKESFKWRMKAIKLDGPSANITGAARIEDLNGAIIKSYKPWTNQSISKQKTSNEYSPNLKEGSYNIISEIIVGCDDINKGNNIDIRAITIKTENIEMQESNIAVQQIILENQEPQNATPQTQENEPAKNPAINESQDNEVQSQEYREEYENTANLKNENTQNSIQIAEPIKSDEEAYAYVSSNEKAKNLVVYSLLAVSIILNIVLIWRR